MLIAVLAVVVAACASHGALALILAMFAAVTVYVLVTLVHPVHRCVRCRGRRVIVHGSRAQACRPCRASGRTRRLGAPVIHRLAWSLIGPALRSVLEVRHEELREKAGYPE